MQLISQHCSCCGTDIPHLSPIPLSYFTALLFHEFSPKITECKWFKDKMRDILTILWLCQWFPRLPGLSKVLVPVFISNAGRAPAADVSSGCHSVSKVTQDSPGYFHKCPAPPASGQAETMGILKGKMDKMNQDWAALCSLAALGTYQGKEMMEPYLA